MIIYNSPSYLSTLNFDFLEFILIFMWVLRRRNLQMQSEVCIIDFFLWISIRYNSFFKSCTMNLRYTFTIPMNASSSSLCFFTCRLAIAPFHRFCIFVAAIATDMVSMVFPETIEITFEHFQRLRINIKKWSTSAIQTICIIYLYFFQHFLVFEFLTLAWLLNDLDVLFHAFEAS